ncbi:hypothetical protein ACRRS0_03130 [Agarivorans sp. QJM3NY_29]|uniref:hypothetical protein n=1 Tax=unclassified Agarivorans TaxID=2636026 RepID=UPI003D7D4717
MKLALLYTLEANIALFKPYLEQHLEMNKLDIKHYVHPELLQRAIEQGLSEQLIKAVQQVIQQIAQAGAELIVCTCSTIGDIAENTPNVSARVIRVDRPMANQAVQAQRVRVFAALQSTLTPTLELIASCAQQQAKNPRVNAELIPQAWSYYLAGDTDNYARTIAQHINQQRLDDDVIVLAQASMAHATQYIQQPNISILNSPELAAHYLREQLQFSQI